MVNRFSVAYCDKESFYCLFVIAVVEKIGKRVCGWRRGPGQPVHSSCQQISDLLVRKKGKVTIADMTALVFADQRFRCRYKRKISAERDGTFHFPGSALSYSYLPTADMNDGGESWQSPRCPLSQVYTNKNTNTNKNIGAYT